MKNTNFINSKIKEMLEGFGQQQVTVGSLFFTQEKPGPKERLELRYKLIKQIKQHKDFKKYQKDFEESQLLHIGSKPERSIASVSLSHTDNIGVFLFTFDKGLSIGFDIENKNRITKTVIERVSSKEERLQAPEKSLLWTAKEAGFKCLSDTSNKLLLSDCLISQWTKNKLYTFQCHSQNTKRKASGVAGFIDDWAIAYAEVKTQCIRK